MSDIANRIAQIVAQAALDWTDIESDDHEHTLECTDWVAYLEEARAIEAAVRARIAADIEAVRAEEEEAFASSGLKGELAERWEGMQDAAQIAAGGESS